MKKNILTVEESIRLSEKLKQQGKQIVLAGGCFDILHLGHIKFLESAKKLQQLGYHVYASKGTAAFLVENGIAAEPLHWPLELLVRLAMRLLPFDKLH